MHSRQHRCARGVPPKLDRTEYEQQDDDEPAETMDMDTLQMQASTAITLRNEEKPEHDTVLLACLKSAVWTTMRRVDSRC